VVRIALFSDIHGNTTALDAVLRDIDASGGADEYWVLGDLVALGHDPIGVYERLVALPSATVIGGNTDRYVVTGERPPPTLDQATADPALVAQVAEVAASFAWTAGCAAACGMTRWLVGLPQQHRAVLPDGTRVLAVHASPQSDGGKGISPRRTDDELRALLDGCDADIVFGGHTHRPEDRRVDDVRAVNLGSVSNPVPPDLRASYVIVDADSEGHRVEHRRVAYDHDAVIAALERVNHPGRAWLIAHQRGEVD
jgi:predicted phosphodiesterase